MSSAQIDRPRWRPPLAPTHALWLGPGGLWDHGPAPGWRGRAHAPPHHLPRHHPSFEAWCQAMPGHGCQLVLSAWLLHELLLDPQLPLRDDTARLAYARGLLQHYHGEAAAQWPLAAWQAGGRHGVSALHALTLPALQASARQGGVALRSVRPWWSLALAAACRQQPALEAAAQARLLVVDGSLVTQITLANGRVQQLLQRRLASTQAASLDAWHATLPALTCSVAIGHGLDTPWPTYQVPGGLQALGSLQGPAPASLWATPAAEAAMPTTAAA